MNRFLTSMALAMATLAAAAATTEAAGPNKGSGSERGGRNDRNDYHTRFGTKFSHGYFYRGRDHNHWTYRYFWRDYGCECYFCPSTSCWYYWCEPRGAYLPVSCIDFAPPTTVSSAAAAASSSSVVAPTVVTNVIGSTPTPGPADLPPPLPPVAPPPNVKNTAIGTVGTSQPVVGPSVPLPPSR